MKSLTTKAFRKMLDDLPGDVQENARAGFRKWQENPASVGWKQLHGPRGDVWSAAIGNSYRAIGVVSKEHGAVAWVFIGSHEAYNGFVSNLRGKPALKPLDFEERIAKSRASARPSGSAPRPGP